MSKKILIVTYGFPPSNTIPVQRILRLTKWLPRYGWEPTILTVKTKYAHPVFYGNVDENLNSLVSDQSKVHRAFSFEQINRGFLGKVQVRIMRSLAIPDPYFTWVPGAVLKGKKLIEEHDIDIVLTTIGPNSTALIGYFLKKLTQAKWVIDYRDPWCLNPFKPLGGVRLFLEKKIEDSMLSNSDSNVTTSNLITRSYIENYPKIAEKFFTITNCYDEQLQFVCEPQSGSSQRDDKFRIVHAGSFYTKRNPTSFLESLSVLISKHPELRTNLEVLFVGTISNDFREQISTVARRLSINCQMTGAVSYKESMRYICSSNLLLAINGVEERDNIFIPGKLFDYIAAKKPILLIGQRGAASEIVDDGNLGTTCSHRDFEGISEYIFRIYRRWEQSLEFKPNTQNVRKFHASKVAAQLARVLDAVVSPRST